MPGTIEPRLAIAANAVPHLRDAAQIVARSNENDIQTVFLLHLASRPTLYGAASGQIGYCADPNMERSLGHCQATPVRVIGRQ
jgi:hypothetical protein